MFYKTIQELVHEKGISDLNLTYDTYEVINEILYEHYCKGYRAGKIDGIGQGIDKVVVAAKELEEKAEAERSYHAQ